MKKLQLALLASGLVIAGEARATVIGPATIGPGNSVDISWNDGNNPTIDALEAVIVSGNATFDQPITVTDPGWSGVLLNSTSVFASGLATSSDQTITLSFADGMPSSGVQVDLYYWLAGSPLPNIDWQWLNLQANTGPNEVTDWEYLDVLNSNFTSPSEPVVPEPTTIFAGALLLLPLGVSAVRILRRRQSA